MATIIEFAPAKINLALHVTGLREDGYHLLDTLVVFADVGDRIDTASSAEDNFSISGMFASGLPADASASGGNLVLRARDLLRAVAQEKGCIAEPVSIHLEKNLPVSSGIGGGSADAAATLRALNRLWRLDLSYTTLQEIGLKLGADVPMCIESRTLVARGIGEQLEAIERFPNFYLLLVNPLVGVSTPEIFKRLANKSSPSISLPKRNATAVQWFDAIRIARNDLQPVAAGIEAKIDETLALLYEAGGEIVRMSGSGATCFSVFTTREQAVEAKVRLEKQRPDWYVMVAETFEMSPHE